MAEHAEKEGVLLLIEPEPGLLIETADQFLELMQHVDSPAIGLNFDIGHFFCVGDDRRRRCIDWRRTFAISISKTSPPRAFIIT